MTTEQKNLSIVIDSINNCKNNRKSRCTVSKALLTATVINYLENDFYVLAVNPLHPSFMDIVL